MENTQLPKNEFVREQIKNKPKNKKRFVVKLLEAFLCGIMFALAVCLVVLFLWPFMKDRLLVPVSSTEMTETMGLISEETENEFPSESELETESEIVSETQPEDTQNVVEIPKEFTLADYQKLQNELYGIGAKANKSIVTITSVVSDTDWFNNSYERVGQGCGTIIAETDLEYLILTERKLIKDASEIRVTFVDDTVASAKLHQYDGNTGIAIVSVEKELVEAATKNRIAVMEISNSGKVYRGSLVVAVGSPLGTNYSIMTGTISATNNELSLWDSNYKVFTTDIVANKSSSGVLVDVDGKLLGLVMQHYSASTATTLTALRISELQLVIDLLAEKKPVPYLGLHVSTITDKISTTYNLPKGVYIKEVAMDSPAMKAGLQSGDVIVRVGNTNVTTDNAYRKVVLSLLPEEECPVVVRRFGNDAYQEIVCRVQPEVLK